MYTPGAPNANRRIGKDNGAATAHIRRPSAPSKRMKRSTLPTFRVMENSLDLANDRDGKRAWTFATQTKSRAPAMDSRFLISNALFLGDQVPGRLAASTADRSLPD